jgi:hypothetical protein
VLTSLRRRRDHHRADAVATRPAVPLPAATVLSLQRTAGNAAVTAWLSRRTLPDEPKSLAEVAPAAAKDMYVDTTDVSFTTASYFRGGHPKHRDGIAVEVRFGGAMAAKADVNVEKKVREGLESMVLGALELADTSSGKPIVDATHFEELDISPWGGQDGRYRFTSVVRRWGTKDGKRWPAEVDVIVELVGARRQELKTGPKLGRDRRSALENRFAQLGFTRAEPTLDRVVDTWTSDQWEKVLQALEYLPEGMLQTVPAIEWERGHGKLGPSGEAGEYQMSVNAGKVRRHLTLFDDAFTSDDELIKVIAHEIGHAFSFKPAETPHDEDAPPQHVRLVPDAAGRESGPTSSLNGPAGQRVARAGGPRLEACQRSTDSARCGRPATTTRSHARRCGTSGRCWSRRRASRRASACSTWRPVPATSRSAPPWPARTSSPPT